MMMNSPLQLIQMIQRGGNPQQLVMQAAQNNPILRQAMQAVNGRTPEQVRDMAYQMARQQGVDLDRLAKQLGIKLPK
ncbi:MAG: hypothetical protein J6J78_02775 [Clostridia bacterium]|nr:hypothetical protein [Clostridia bacterium]